MSHNSLISYRSLLFILIFVIISHNVISTGIYVDITYLLCLIIFLYDNNKSELLFPIIVFIFGIYQDILTNNIIGYSSLIFLSFLLVKEILKYFAIYNIKNAPFFAFISILTFLFLINFIYLSLNYEVSLSIHYEIIPILITIIFYKPIEFVMNFIRKIDD